MITVEFLNRDPVTSQKVEIVERKGIGHPDSLADGIAEEISRTLSLRYMEEFGEILHHNTDHVQIVGGEAEPEIGGGKVTKPIYVLLAGRATTEYNGKEIPVNEIAYEVAVKYLDDTVRFLNPKEHVEISPMIRPGSIDLRELFKLGGDVPRANDTSFGVGFAPMTPLEKTVLEVEMELNSDSSKRRVPSLGEDIKVMGTRNGDKYSLTIASAMVSSQLSSYEEYYDAKEKVREIAISKAKKILGSDKELEVVINAADEEERVVYITVTGTSAEAGDDGSTGRGNRVNGLITPFRPMSLEAACGKNPVSHIGKLYNVMAHKIAEEIHSETGALEVYVRLQSRIGSPINQPENASVQILDYDIENRKRILRESEEIVKDNLNEIWKLTEMIVKGKIKTF
ncbi:S-adenosylmethionine synthetase [Candidatus Bathyarchaeota archaeon ex4484_205]|nr:MAG: S-adenosylmethionine synthetase [Candidatus Bathyarchaeota archaeon ex4484_205]RLF90416.1 MAG: methionine adenosyltransferase [Thermococci archaeon]RLF96615.1 MAG: methionine adenosyltransferase [Thermococci archaeon]